jgi:hypothetical protein
VDPHILLKFGLNLRVHQILSVLLFGSFIEVIDVYTLEVVLWIFFTCLNHICLLLLVFFMDLGAVLDGFQLDTKAFLEPYLGELLKIPVVRCELIHEHVKHFDVERESLGEGGAVDTEQSLEESLVRVPIIDLDIVQLAAPDDVNHSEVVSLVHLDVLG